LTLKGLIFEIRDLLEDKWETCAGGVARPTIVASRFRGEFKTATSPLIAIERFEIMKEMVGGGALPDYQRHRLLRVGVWVRDAEDAEKTLDDVVKVVEKIVHDYANAFASDNVHLRFPPPGLRLRPEDKLTPPPGILLEEFLVDAFSIVA